MLYPLEKELVVHAPGRINLIGEHIDYNGGLVLPGAIDRKIIFRFRRVEGETATIYSQNFDAGFRVELKAVQSSDQGWHNYLLGVLHFINKIRPGQLSGFHCEIESHLPIGAGISSSAALECGFAKGLDGLFGLQLSDTEIITVGREAEHHFAGTKCGIMDQFAVVKGKRNKLILLNTDTVEFEYVNADFDDYCLLLLNSNIEHELASGAYNERRSQCEKALEIVNEYAEADYAYLAQVPLALLDELSDKMPEVVFRRATFVIEEQQRVRSAVRALEQGDMTGLGGLLYATHQGLSAQYEVSCPETDFLVHHTRNFDAVAGARMMGGGFGGCTLNLLKGEYMDAFISKMSEAYRREFGIDLTPIAVNLNDGVKVIDHE